MNFKITFFLTFTLIVFVKNDDFETTPFDNTINYKVKENWLNNNENSNRQTTELTSTSQTNDDDDLRITKIDQILTSNRENLELDSIKYEAGAKK